MTRKREDADKAIEDASQPETAKGTETATPPTAAEGSGVRPASTAGKRFKLVRTSTDPEDSYADGALGVFVRDTILKLDLYRVIGTDNDSGDELRAVSHRLVLPITAVVELIRLLQGTLQRLQQDGRVRIERVGDRSEPETKLG